MFILAILIKINKIKYFSNFAEIKPCNHSLLVQKSVNQHSFVWMKNINIASRLFKKTLFASIMLCVLGVWQHPLAAQGCGCTNCPQFMPDNFVGEFLISVDGATNPTLGQNGQGVCGVSIHFDHQYLGDLIITLSSPSGQTITLVGPDGFWGPTGGDDWNVSFLSCNTPVVPDPGFSDQWDSNQDWSMGNLYSGSYYPSNGCLEDFNSGPVAGTWTLKVEDTENGDVGNLYDYELIFCDPDGINCFDCEADAGNLAQPNVMACQGDSMLHLNLPPTYIAPMVPPAAPDYAYKYIISDTAGVILAYMSVPNLSGYKPGIYTVCGLSFMVIQESNIPVPDSLLTVAQLSAKLNSGSPPFCGNITGNCVEVTIYAVPPDVQESVEICSPDCYPFYGLNYCQPGTFIRNLASPEGCPYQATLNLTVHQPVATNLVEFVCNGSCATTPGFEDHCSPGMYQESYQTSFGCDSIVFLDLQVLQVTATAAPLGVLDCNTPSIQITGAGSTTGGGVTYFWTASNGGHILGPNSNINVLADKPGDYQLLVCRNGAGVYCCDSMLVTVIDQSIPPPAPTFLTGPSLLCPGSTASYSVADIAGATAYNWTLTNGVIISGQGSDSIQVNWNANAAMGTVCVNASNTCGTSADTCINISFSTPAAGQISHQCDSSNTSYTVSFLVSGGTAPYIIAGGAISGGIFTAAPIPSGQPYSFVIADNNGCMSGPITGSFNCSCATSAGIMDLTLLSACADQTVTATQLGGQILDVDDVGSFVLHSGPGTSLVPIIFGQNTTGTFGFQPGMVYGQTYYISFVVGNNLGGFPDPLDPCFSVSQGQPLIFYPYPAANAGLDRDTCGLSQILSANASPGVGLWSILSEPLGDSLDIFNIHNPNTAVHASGNGAFSLQWTLNNNGCIDADTVVLNFNPSPSILAPTETCDGSNQHYILSFQISGGTPGYVITGLPNGNGSGNGFASDPIPNGGTYAYLVTDSLGCSSAPLNGSYSCNCGSNAGSMALNTRYACEGDSITAQYLGGASLDANDTTSYILHTLPGTTLGTVFAQNNTGIFGIQAGMAFGVPYYVSYVVGNNLAGIPDLNDPCLSIAAGQPVVFYKNPVADAGTDLSTCGTLLNLNANTPTGSSGQWSVVIPPSGGSLNISDLQSATASATDTVFGTYTLAWTLSLNGCIGSDQVDLHFNDSPVLDTLVRSCDMTNGNFVVTLTLSGGALPYSVNGQAIAGNTFMSNSFPSGASYSFNVTDVNGCFIPQIMGDYSCNCATNAGSMQTSPAIFCADLPATAIWNNDANLDANDLLLFVLHNAAGTTLGSTIFGTNSQPSFTFGGNLQFGVTYYISAVAANNIAGTVDLNDPCLSVAPGAAVQWKPLPTATISGDSAICQGGNALLSFSGSGTYPLTVDYEDGVNLQTLLLNGPQTVSINVAPFATTTYKLIQVTDGTSPNCASTLVDSVTVTMHPPVNAGTPQAALEFCAGEGQWVQLASLLTGEDPGGQWTETSSAPSLPGTFNATAGTFQPNGQAAGTYTFRYYLSALAPCTDDAAQVTVIIYPVPMADAGLDKILNCNNLSVNLGGTGSSTGIYYWILNGDTISTDRQIVAKEGGLYTLWVTTTQGCKDSDAVIVTADAEAPKADLVSTRNVRCFGEQNGAVSVDAVSSAHPPVLFSLNGGPFGTLSSFTGLAQGDYLITLQDATGCESMTNTYTINEPPKLIADLGADLQLQLGDSAHIHLQSSVPVDELLSIFWQPLPDSIAAGKPYQNFLPFYNLQVEVTIKDSSGCTAEDRILVQVEKKHHIYIPNVFKPDGDIDPLLYVFGSRDVEEIESFQIYDRWGDKVYEQFNFQANDQTIGWDGIAHGSKVDPGVFAYFAVVRFINGERIVYKGDVTVLR